MGKARGADALRRSTPQVKTRPQVPPLGMIRRRPLNPQDGARETAVLGGTPDRESIRTMRTETNESKDGKAAAPVASRPGSPAQDEYPGDIVAIVRSFNSEHKAHEEQYGRTRQASDRTRRARDAAAAERQKAEDTHAGYLTAQAEHPERRGPLLVMVLAALVTLALDGFASYFAAESLGGDQQATFIWTGIFLAVLAILEGGLALSAERNKKAFRLITLALGMFATFLALLRFVFFSAIGGGPIASVIGAALFTACTILFVWAGFLALRYCETVDIWRARCQDRNAARKADAAEDRAAGQAANRDRLTDAYLSRLRPSLLRSCTAPQMAGVENDIRAHLAGEQA